MNYNKNCYNVIMGKTKTKKNIPNAKTLQAIKDVNNGKNLSKAFSNLDDLFKSLNA